MRLKQSRQVYERRPPDAELKFVHKIHSEEGEVVHPRAQDLSRERVLLEVRYLGRVSTHADVHAAASRIHHP